MRQGGGAVGRRHGAGDVALDLAQATVGQPFLHQVERADDALQKIVEVVGDAAGELADGFHFLRLAQRLLGVPQRLGCLLLVGDVACDGIDQAFVRSRGPGQPPIGAILVPQAVLEALGSAAARQMRLFSCGPGRIVGMLQPLRGPAEHVAPALQPSVASIAGLTLSQMPLASATTSRSCDTFQMRSRSRVRASTSASSVSFIPRSSISACLADVMSCATPMKPTCSPSGPQRGCDSERSQRHWPSPRR